jgi:hypothetical protein
VRVPSSARPEAPKVLYVIPAFRWTKGAGTSERHGGGLRVYMERGWYSSGDGELLGVVLASNVDASAPTVLAENDPLRNFVSQWGADPLRASAGTNGLLAPAHFTNALNANPTGGDFQTAALSLEERPDEEPAFTVAPHAVGYDETRRLWYCDVEIDPGASYFPFVRLALARYQPNSIAGAHLSRVVQADFIQLAPGRSATVAATGQKLRYAVTLAGVTYSRFKDNDGKTQTGGTDVTVTYESAIPNFDNPATRKRVEELDWTPGETFPLSRGENDDAWKGHVTLPEVPSPVTRLYRLVIREFETLFDASGESRWRLVYADVIRMN